MIKELENLVKDLNNGKIYGATTNISKLLKISNVAVHNWLIGNSIPSTKNIKEIAKKTKRKVEDIQKIFIENSAINSNNKISFNHSNTREVELLKKEIELKNKEIELLKKEMELLKK